MNDQNTVPYRTPTGLEIGKYYQPPKPRNVGSDLIDIYDQDRIQMAYITDGNEWRIEKITLIVSILAVLFLSVLLIALGN
jgi:hypothetical protein